MRYHIWTVGCQMNKADSERIADSLERLGLTEASAKEEADVIVINSCSVRRSAEERVLGRLSALKPLKKTRPELIVGLAGCMVGSDTTALRRQLPFVDVFLRPLEVDGLLQLVLERRPPTAAPPSSAPMRASSGTDLPSGFEEIAGDADCFGGNGRNSDQRSPQQSRNASPVRFVPIIYGCDNFCSYCIVPFRRGRERSRPTEEILEEIRRLVSEGVHQVTLLGQNVDSYGHDLRGKPDLAGLLEKVDEVHGLQRIRFLTSHPKDMSDRLIAAVARLPKVCECINLPVQSGDDAILRAMKRGYTVADYRDLARRVRASIRDVSLTTDLIVGFPGESREQFESSYRLLEEIRFDVVHVAAYSPRPGTAAARLMDDVPAEEKHERLQRVEALQERIAAEGAARLLGATVEVLVEGRNKGKWLGRTRGNRLVFFEARGEHNEPLEEQWLGRLVQLKIVRTSAWSLQGQLF